MRLLLVTLSFFLFQNSYAFDSGVIPGHEVITRFAISSAKHQIIRTNGKLSLPLWDGYPGERGSQTQNPLMRGNYATDQPARVCEVDLRSYYGVPGIDHMELDGRFQHQHFLRNFGPYGVLSAQATCMAARQSIVNATLEGLKNFSNNLYRAEFFFGHATHTIQDSFSQAHASRGNNFFTPLAICTYGISFPGICRHGEMGSLPYDPHDNVWQMGEMCRFRRTPDCLKPEAQAAIRATAGYLVKVDEILKNRLPMELVPTLLNQYFDSPAVFNGGYLNCNSLARY